MIVYKATNKKTGRVYIGITTKPLEHRIRQHTNDAKSSLYEDIRKKHGFIWEIIEECESLEELAEREKYHISQYQLLYNKTEGGFGRWTHKEETVERISKAVKLAWKRTPHPQLGKPLTLAHKNKISKTRTQQKIVLTPEQRKAKGKNNWKNIKSYRVHFIDGTYKDFHGIGYAQISKELGIASGLFYSYVNKADVKRRTENSKKIDYIEHIDKAINTGNQKPEGE